MIDMVTILIVVMGFMGYMQVIKLLNMYNFCISVIWYSGKESACQCRRHGFVPCLRKIPWRRKWKPIPVFLPWKSHGQRSLVGYSQWGHKQPDTTEHTHTDIYLNKVFRNQIIRISVKILVKPRKT